VEELARRCEVRLKTDRKVSSAVAAVRIVGTRCQLAVPQTFMNESGRAVSQLLRRHPVESWEQLVVIHDELDLDPGVVKVKRGGGRAGHNGLRSITEHLGTQDYVRVRIGVGKPPHASRGADHVLSRVPKAERVLLDEATVRAADAVADLIENGVDAAMAIHNARS
jgi:PTH1 family peptidyl-tRNA hydrolase